MIMYSPLEQFALITFVPFHIGSLYFNFTNSSLFIILAVSLIVSLLSITINSRGRMIPTVWQSLVEIVYEFVVSVVERQTRIKGKPYFPLIITLFVIILACNLIRIIPYSFTATSHFAVTMRLSFSLFVGVTLIRFAIHRLHFFSFFLPARAPLILAPLLVVLEIVSYSFRGISLRVRLFANIIAGHTLVKILCGFSWAMLRQRFVLTLRAAVPIVVVIALTGLEIIVARLQAYVFTVLLCIYLNDSINLHLYNTKHEYYTTSNKKTI